MRLFHTFGFMLWSSNTLALLTSRCTRGVSPEVWRWIKPNATPCATSKRWFHCNGGLLSYISNANEFGFSGRTIHIYLTSEPAFQGSIWHVWINQATIRTVGRVSDQLQQIFMAVPDVVNSCRILFAVFIENVVWLSVKCIIWISYQ